MKPDCKVIRERLADAADGQEIPAVVDHLQNCAACQKELDLLKQIIQGLRARIYEPGSQAIERAMALMPPLRVRTARLVLGKMGLVRSTTLEEFQLVFEEEDLHVRLMYQPLPTGWSVTGRVDGKVSSIEGPSGEIKVEESGRFQFEVSDLQDTDLYISSEAGMVKIPTALEATSDGTDRSS